MRTGIITFLMPIVAAAQVSVEVTAMTATQAVLLIRGASGMCTGTLTETASGAVHPYVNDVDLSKLANYIPATDDMRIVTLGREAGDDALRESTDYSLSLTCGGVSVPPVNFSTKAPYFGPQPARSIPFDPSRFGNRAWPRIDWTRAGKNKTYTDPLTGIAFKVVIGNGNWGVVHPFNGGLAFPRYFGGSEWTNPERVGNGGTSNYGSVTGSTNPLDLLVDPAQWPWGDGTGRWGIENLGLLVWGQGSEAAEADRQIKVGVHDGTGYLMYQIVTLPQGTTGAGTVSKVNSGATDDGDYPWPASFREGGFSGWTINKLLARNMFPIRGLQGITQRTIDVSGGSNIQLNATGIGYAHHLPVTLKTGNKLWLAGSSCPNELCTIATVTDHDTATISDAIADGAYSTGYTVWPFSIRVEKVTAAGTVEVGLKHKALATQGTYVTAAPGSITCGPWTVTDYEGRTGSECVIPDYIGVGGGLYFISDDLSVVKQVSRFYRNLPGQLTGWNSADIIPSSAPTPLVMLYPGPASQPHAWYMVHANTAGTRSLYKMTYTGDYSQEWAPGYVLNSNGSPVNAEVLATGTDYVVWENLMKPSEGRDLAAQVAALAPNDPEWYGANWSATTAGLAGVSGTKGIVKVISGGALQDGGTCLIAVVDLPTGTVQRVFGTGKGIDDFPAAIRWGACHSLGASNFDDTFWISQNYLGNKGSGGLFAGPFRVTPNAVKMPDGSWNTNTAMAWPTGHASNTYDKTCPTDIPEWLQEYGATGTQCVTMKLPHHPCHILPNATALAQQPACPSNAAHTMPQELKVGDRAYDIGTTPTPSHNEHFRVVKITPLPDNELEVVWSRNSVWDYCCRNDDPASPRTNFCVVGTPGMTHANGFTLQMVMGHTNSCRDTTTSFTVAADGSIIYTGETSASSGGHTAAGSWPDGKVLFSGFGGSRILSSQADLDTKYPNSDGQIAHSFPKFAGHTAQIGSNQVQAYFNRDQKTAADHDLEWTIDANHLNNYYGGTDIGARTLTNISGDVWKIQVLGGTVDYKRRPLLGWAGVHVLKDVSPANIASAADYSLCHVYRAGDCGTGSIGETFVKVPRVYPSANCDTAMMWGNSPCVFSGEPVTGWIRRFDASKPDVDGRSTQNLTMGLAGPGLQPSFWGAKAGPTGKFFAAVAGNWVDGVRMATVIGRMPEWKPALARNDFGGLTVEVGPSPGVTHARVRFGYNASFHCTERLEACLTDENITPFAFESETLTAKECASGCSIPVPAIPGRVLYYRVETYIGFEWIPGAATATVAE